MEDQPSSSSDNRSSLSWLRDLLTMPESSAIEAIAADKSLIDRRVVYGVLIKGILCTFILKAILRLFIYKASYLGSKTTMTTGEWSCLISYAWDPLTRSEGRGGSEKFKMKIFVSSGIRTHASPRHD